MVYRAPPVVGVLRYVGGEAATVDFLYVSGGDFRSSRKEFLAPTGIRSAFVCLDSQCRMVYY